MVMGLHGYRPPQNDLGDILIIDLSRISLDIGLVSVNPGDHLLFIIKNQFNIFDQGFF